MSDLLKKYLLQPVINASGSVTRLGGAPMPQAVVDAMAEMAQHTVPLDVLQGIACRAIASATRTEAGLVTAGAAAGLTLNNGNSDTILFTLNVIGTKKWRKNELLLSADGSYGESDGVKNSDYIRGISQYNRLLYDDRLYVYGNLDVLHDNIAEVEYRATLGPGAGYYIIRNDTRNLSVESGLSYVFEEVGGISDDYLAVRFAEKFEQKIGDRARIWQGIEYLPQVDDFGNYILNFEVGIEADLTKDIALRVYLQDNYRNRPAAGRKNNDLKLVSALAYKF